jgi:hypothetical protein
MISLYIKTHNTTGMKYLGKTTRNPFKYRGSGKPVAEISRLLNISWNAAKSVISNSYLLKEE